MVKAIVKDILIMSYVIYTIILWDIVPTPIHPPLDGLWALAKVGSISHPMVDRRGVGTVSHKIVVQITFSFNRMLSRHKT